ncbi:uncharacterized protein LOC119599257 [Penaeus monodon]|uniref:uncharacterized protein LOC119599257 n=1 Tax=Penaeus monodon TaxID=6687 RepID=UPI0018A7326A|nr:uncharacterized protein LOC119599257 [Penaeus monodon]
MLRGFAQLHLRHGLPVHLGPPSPSFSAARWRRIYAAIYYFGGEPFEFSSDGFSHVEIYRSVGKGFSAKAGDGRPINPLTHSIEMTPLPVLAPNAGFPSEEKTNTSPRAKSLYTDKHKKHKRKLMIKCQTEFLGEMYAQARSDREIRENDSRDYKNVTTKVRCTVGMTDGFEVKVGLHQGLTLSPILFNVVMDVMTEEVREEPPWCLL